MVNQTTDSPGYSHRTYFDSNGYFGDKYGLEWSEGF